MHVLVVPCVLKLFTLQAQDEQSSAGRPKGGHSVVRVLACHDDHKKGRGGMPLLVNQVDLEQVSYRSSVALL